MNKLRLPKESEVTTFKSWWEINKAVYIKLKIERDIAYTIWCAEVESSTNAIYKLFTLNK